MRPSEEPLLSNATSLQVKIFSSKENLVPMRPAGPILPPLSPWPPLVRFLSLWIPLFYIVDRNGITPCWPFVSVVLHLV